LSHGTSSKVPVRDLVLGAPLADDGAGRVYILKGGDRPKEHLGPKDAYATLLGEPDEWAGYAVAVGRFNDDKVDDLMISALNYSHGRGRVYVVHGPIEPGEHNLADRADATLTGAFALGSFGRALEAVDLDGDGGDEVVIGAPYASFHESFQQVQGAVYVYKDPKGDDAEPAFHLGGSQIWGGLGQSLSSGDVNGDGFDDLLVGEPATWCHYAADHDEPHRRTCPNTPSTFYLVNGRRNLPQRPEWIADVADASVSTDPNAGQRLTEFASSLATVDINHDGYDDVIVGSHGMDNAYLFYGGDKFKSGTELGLSMAAAVFDGSGTRGLAGRSVANLGDLDADGIDDLMVTSIVLEWPDSPPTSLSGGAYLWFGEK
jgi:hypothetical protein